MNIAITSLNVSLKGLNRTCDTVTKRVTKETEDARCTQQRR